MKGTYHLPEVLIKRAVEYRRKQNVDVNEEASVREERTADRKSTRLNSSHTDISRMPSSA